MDRSYWSDPEVIEAARDFVCIRLVTYENGPEGEFVQSIFRGRDGTLENSIFAILAPDGETPLTRSGRSPSMVFGADSEELSRALLLKEMAKIQKRYPQQKSVSTVLPASLDLRRAMNVASCDLQPLVILFAGEEGQRNQLAHAVAKLAWDTQYRGRYAYAWAQNAVEMEALTGLVVNAEKPSLWIVAPNEFGTEARLLQEVHDPNPSTLKRAFEAAAKEFTIGSRDSRQHYLRGKAEGVFWVSQFPNTDPKSDRVNR